MSKTYIARVTTPPRVTHGMLIVCEKEEEVSYFPMATIRCIQERVSDYGRRRLEVRFNSDDMLVVEGEHAILRIIG